MANNYPGQAVWYIDSVQWSNVAAWAATTSYSPGAIVRQSATPTVGNERCFVATQSSAQNSGSTEPTWTVTRGAKQSIDGSVQWYECTGIPALNGETLVGGN